MKLKEFFGLSNPETRQESAAASPEVGPSEAPKKVVETLDERELKYEEAIEKSNKEYADEILKVQGQIDEAAKNGKGPEEMEKLKKLATALREGSVKARQNLEEALAGYKRSKREREDSSLAEQEEESKHKRY